MRLHLTVMQVIFIYHFARITVITIFNLSRKPYPGTIPTAAKQQIPGLGTATHKHVTEHVGLVERHNHVYRLELHGEPSSLYPKISLPLKVKTWRVE